MVEPRRFYRRPRDKGGGLLLLANKADAVYAVRTLRLTAKGEREALEQSLRRILTKVHPGCEGLR